MGQMRLCASPLKHVSFAGSIREVPACLDTHMSYNHACSVHVWVRARATYIFFRTATEVAPLQLAFGLVVANVQLSAACINASVVRCLGAPGACIATRSVEDTHTQSVLTMEVCT